MDVEIKSKMKIKNKKLINLYNDLERDKKEEFIKYLTENEQIVLNARLNKHMLIKDIAEEYYLTEITVKKILERCTKKIITYTNLNKYFCSDSKIFFKQTLTSDELELFNEIIEKRITIKDFIKNNEDKKERELNNILKNVYLKLNIYYNLV